MLIACASFGQSEANGQYDKIIRLADYHFFAGDVSRAELLYERALKFNPNDPHPLNQLIWIRGAEELGLPNFCLQISEVINRYQKANDRSYRYDKLIQVRIESCTRSD